MFKTVNPYDQVIAKATDEKQTDVNWDDLLTVWDKVNDDGEAGARNGVAALQKRLQHRSANVQLFALTLADALVNNCKAPLHKEISGKAFTQTLVRLVNDRNTHEDVKKKILKLIDSWIKDHEKDPNFELLAEVWETLKAQNHKLDDQEESAPKLAGPTDDTLRREEEDLQRALAESAALASGSSLRNSNIAQTSVNNSYSVNEMPAASAGKALPGYPDERANGIGSERQTGNASSAPRWVRGLYNFETQGSDELGFRTGDVIKVLECLYPDWWKGELRGQVGIFPSSYVEVIPEPEQDTKAQETEMESDLFAQSASIDRLLSMMRGLSNSKENLAENEELLDLYQQSMALRPKVVRLIEKYNQKQIELQAINDKFARAKSTYDQMLQQSMDRYNPALAQQSDYGQSYGYGGYGGQPPPQNYSAQQQPPQQRPYNQGVQHQSYPAQQSTSSTVASNGSQLQDSMAADPFAGWTPEQKRSYQQQWAEYERAMAAYNAQQAQLMQGQQQVPNQQELPASYPVNQSSAAPPQVGQVINSEPQTRYQAPPVQTGSGYSTYAGGPPGQSEDPRFQQSYGPMYSGYENAPPSQQVATAYKQYENAPPAELRREVSQGAYYRTAQQQQEQQQQQAQNIQPKSVNPDQLSARQGSFPQPSPAFEAPEQQQQQQQYSGPQAPYSNQQQQPPQREAQQSQPYWDGQNQVWASQQGQESSSSIPQNSLPGSIPNIYANPQPQQVEYVRTDSPASSIAQRDPYHRQGSYGAPSNAPGQPYPDAVAAHLAPSPNASYANARPDTSRQASGSYPSLAEGQAQSPYENAQSLPIGMQNLSIQPSQQTMSTSPPLNSAGPSTYQPDQFSATSSAQSPTFSPQMQSFQPQAPYAAPLKTYQLQDNPVQPLNYPSVSSTAVPNLSPVGSELPSVSAGGAHWG